jgi:hypothetical protein
LFKSANDADDLGFLAKGKARPNLVGIYDLTLLDQVLIEKGLPSVDDTVQARSHASSTEGEVLPDVVS